MLDFTNITNITNKYGRVRRVSDSDIPKYSTYFSINIGCIRAGGDTLSNTSKAMDNLWLSDEHWTSDTYENDTYIISDKKNPHPEWPFPGFFVCFFSRKKKLAFMKLKFTFNAFLFGTNQMRWADTEYVQREKNIWNASGYRSGLNYGGIHLVGTGKSLSAASEIFCTHVVFSFRMIFAFIFSRS